MDTTTLVVGFLFGMIGTGLFVYGKKSGRLIAIAAGVGLMAAPILISDLLLLTVISVLLMLAPKFLPAL